MSNPIIRSHHKYSPGYEAIQLPPAGEDPTEEFVSALEDFLGDVVWNSDRDETLSFECNRAVYVATPTDYIVKVFDGKFLVYTQEEFRADFYPAP